MDNILIILTIGLYALVLLLTKCIDEILEKLNHISISISKLEKSKDNNTSL